jgi:uncharacterized protein YuzE
LRLPTHSLNCAHFPDTDKLYIELAERDSTSLEAISNNLIVDFDAMGQSVGVTLDHYSSISASSTIQPLWSVTPAL